MRKSMAKNDIYKIYLMGLVIDYIDLKKEVGSEFWLKENNKNKEQRDQSKQFGQIDLNLQYTYS